MRGSASPGSGEDVFDGDGDTVLVVGEGGVFGGGLDSGDGVAHGDTGAGVGDHGEVIDFITDGDDVAGVDVPLVGEDAEGGPLVGVGVEHLEDVELVA